MATNAVYVERRHDDLLPVFHRPGEPHPETICGRGSVHWPMMQRGLAESKGALVCPNCYPFEGEEVDGPDVALRPV